MCEQSPELVDYLLSQGADVNAEDVQRKTALHYAVQAGGGFEKDSIKKFTKKLHPDQKNEGGF